jgi:hypothetical protein
LASGSLKKGAAVLSGGIMDGVSVIIVISCNGFTKKNGNEFRIVTAPATSR